MFNLNKNTFTQQKLFLKIVTFTKFLTPLSLNPSINLRTFTIFFLTLPIMYNVDCLTKLPKFFKCEGVKQNKFIFKSPYIKKNHGTRVL